MVVLLLYFEDLCMFYKNLIVTWPVYCCGVIYLTSHNLWHFCKGVSCDNFGISFKNLCKYVNCNFLLFDWYFRCSHRRCSIKKGGVLTNFAKFTGKYLCQSLFFKNVAGLRPATLLRKRLTQMFYPWEFCEIYKNTFFTEYFWGTASNISIS